MCLVSSHYVTQSWFIIIHSIHWEQTLMIFESKFKYFKNSGQAWASIQRTLYLT